MSGFVCRPFQNVKLAPLEDPFLALLGPNSEARPSLWVFAHVSKEWLKMA